MVTAIAAVSVMKIFVTGATGVVGRRVVPLFIQHGHAVTAIGRTAAKRETLQRSGARAVGVDIFDELQLRQVIAGHDAVVNLATHIPSSTMRMLLPWAWRENDRVRRLGSAALVNAALATGVRRFIQESFAPVYAAHGDVWIDERHLVQPVRYNRSSLDAERNAARFTAAGGGAGVVLRFAGFYGADAFTLREMVDTMRKGWAPLPGSPDAFFSSMSHDDAASAVAAALDLEAGVYNVSDDEPLRRREWVAQLASTLAIAQPRPLPGWVTIVGGSMMELLSRSQRISNRKLRAASTWTPSYPSVRDGFRAIEREWSGGRRQPN
jgi:2-alkyl-3-oxoalkanoate reductase